MYCHVVWRRLKREALTILGGSYINIVNNGYFTFFLEELYRFIEHHTTRCTYIIIRSRFSLAWLFIDATISNSEVTFRNTYLNISCQINTRFAYKSTWREIMLYWTKYQHFIATCFQSVFSNMGLLSIYFCPEQDK